VLLLQSLFPCVLLACMHLSGDKCRMRLRVLLKGL